MNKQRRKKISEIIEKLEDIVAELEELASDERDAYDNLLESIRLEEIINS